MRNAAPSLTDAQIDQLQLDYEGRTGSLLAVDDHVKKLVETCARPTSCKNTLIVFVSDNGWLQGQHRDPGRQVPALRGVAARAADPARPRRAGGPRRSTGRSRTSTSRRRCVDAANAKAGRHDGRRLAAARRSRNPRKRAATGRSRSRRSRRCSAATIPINGVGPALQGRAHRPLHVRRLQGDRRAGALRPPQGPVRAAQRRRGPGLRRRSRRSWRRSCVEARPRCQGPSSLQPSRREGRSCSVLLAAGARSPPRLAARAGGDASAPLTGLHDARYCEIIALKGAPPDATADGLEHDRAEHAAPPPGGTRFDAGDAGARSWARRSSS